MGHVSVFVLNIRATSGRMTSFKIARTTAEPSACSPSLMSSPESAWVRHAEQ